ncbi:MAG: 30S ribosomal protein S8e [Candidatus Woesearchaeota archaeon]
MAITQGKSERKYSGKKKNSYRKKRLFEKGGAPTFTKLGERKVRDVRSRGGNDKTNILRENTANLLDGKTSKWSKVKILNLMENPANRHYVRRNIITKGTIIETEKGKARVTSRPGQSGSINAVLV